MQASSGTSRNRTSSKCKLTAWIFSRPRGDFGMCIKKAHIVRCRLLVVPLRLRFAIRTGSSVLRYSNRFVYTSLFGQVRLCFAIRMSRNRTSSKCKLTAWIFSRPGRDLRYVHKKAHIMRCRLLVVPPGIELVVSVSLLHGFSVAPEVISVCAQKKPTSCDAGF